MKNLTLKNKIIVFALCCFLTFSFCVSSSGVSKSYAATISISDFSKSNALDDLKEADKNGSFDLTSYNNASNLNELVYSAGLCYFVEYGYSLDSSLQNSYKLYVYFYNPQKTDINYSSLSNKIQIATAFDETHEPTDYSKFNLKYCNTSSDKLYSKFYVELNGFNKNWLINNQRVYYISGIELVTKNDNNATEYGVGSKYVFSGYSQGLDNSSKEKSTLTCNRQKFDSIELEVKHTFYRTETSSKGAGYQNQLDTVYFAVPNRFFETYEKLQRIKAEWYEYKTNDIVVTSNDNFYNKAFPYVGVKTGNINEYGRIQYNSNIGISLGQNASDSGDINFAQWGWNLGEYLHPVCQALYYLFKVDDISEYDPYANITKNGGVESNDLYDYILAYNKTHDKGFLDIKDGKVSADLFADDIDAYRKMDTEYGKIQKGYSYYDFDADVDLQKLSAWSETSPSFWDNWITWGLWNSIIGNIPDETSQVLSPIYKLNDSDLLGTDVSIRNNLFVNANDVDDLKNFYAKAKLNDCSVILFRFATSDYYSAPVDIIELNSGFLWSDNHIRGQAYRSWQSVFMDFDIIQLTFKNENREKLTVIPAVSNPIDIVNDITSPINIPDNNLKDLLLKLFGFLSLILLLVLCMPILPYILQFLVKIIIFPVKLVAYIFNAIKNKKRK